MKKNTSDDNSSFTIFEAPNTRLYTLLLVVSLIITCVALFFKTSSHMFTIIAGLGCGGFASTLVAWLIEYANWKDDMIRKRLLRSQLLYNIGECFKNGVSPFIYQSFRCKQVTDLKTKHTWIEWVELAHKGLNENIAEITRFTDALQFLCDNLAKQIHVIEAQKAYLLDGKIISHNDFEVLEGLLDIHAFMHNPRQGPDVDINNYAQTCLGLAQNMKRSLERSKNLRFINSREFESVIGRVVANYMVNP